MTRRTLGLARMVDTAPASLCHFSMACLHMASFKPLELSGVASAVPADQSHSCGGLRVQLTSAHLVTMRSISSHYCLTSICCLRVCTGLPLQSKSWIYLSRMVEADRHHCRSHQGGAYCGATMCGKIVISWNEILVSWFGYGLGPGARRPK